MNEKDILIDKQNMFRLYQNKQGELCIGVMCGSIGLYEVSFKLNKNELQDYQERGKEALRELANAISNEPHKFEDR